MSNGAGIQSRRSFLGGLGGGMLGLTLGGCSAAAPPSRPTNIVLFMIDDLGWRDVGFMGNREFLTPNIDRLAGEGMIFTDAYANAPVCAPSRACLFSGQYTPRHGVYSVSNSGAEPVEERAMLNIPYRHLLPRENVTFMDVLAARGVRGASIGKWNLGTDPQDGPLAQGFAVNRGGNEYGFPAKGYFSPYGNPQLPDGPPGEFLTERLTNEAITFLEANRERQFLLYMSHFGVHDPMEAKEAMVRKHRDRGCKNPIYAAMVESVDLSVGKVLDRLGRLGLERDTLVVFTSDNGGHGCYTDNAPLRGAKSTLYEGGLRVPMCARWPGRIPPGSRSDEPVLSMDLYPTFLEAAGAAAPPNQVLDGQSLLPVMCQRRSLGREAIYWHYPLYMQADHCMTRTWCTTPVGAIRKGRFKLMEYFAPRGTPSTLELYDLEMDPGETNNLASRRPALTADLLADMRAWRRRVNAPIPSEPNPDYMPREG